MKTTVLVAIILATIVFQSTDAAQPYTVTKVVVIAKSNTSAGPCPMTVEFLGTIFVSRPAKVEYRWERSDGTVGPREFVDIRSAGKNVNATWRVGTPRRNFSGWVRLRVLAPNSVVSNTATIQIKCN